MGLNFPMGKFGKLGLVLVTCLIGAPAPASDCSRTSTGFPPLTEMIVAAYQGMPGGLYPDSSNKRPAAHEAAGLRLAASVSPRNATGDVDEQNGRMVLLSIGMSNTTAEFSFFKSVADRDPEKNPRLVIVDGAQGGWSADRIVAGGGEYWTTVDERLLAAGVTAAQVQAAWMKQADAGPTLRFPEDARRLQAELKTLAQTLRSRFPNLRLLYLSSRIYGGYASTSLNPEPYAYQSGFAVKWLIEQQIQGEPDLSFEAGRAPWMAWGPYLWADGTRARNDGLVWNCSEFQDDGTHPANSARQKVAAMLLDFLKTDTTARPWFLRASAQPAPKPVAAALVNAAGYAPAVAPRSIAALFGTELAGSRASASALPLPLTLAGSRVEIGGEPAPLFYVSPTQINLQIPITTAGTSVVVFRDGTQSDPLTATMAIYSPGLFTLDATGKGPVAALHADARPITPQGPARRGETIMLFGTGLGYRDPRSLRPDFLPVVRIGGVSGQVGYSGPAPGFPGLDQINVTVPLDAPTGAAVPVEMQVATAVSNTGTLAVGP